MALVYGLMEKCTGSCMYLPQYLGIIIFQLHTKTFFSTKSTMLDSSLYLSRKTENGWCNSKEAIFIASGYISGFFHYILLKYKGKKSVCCNKNLQK